MTPGKDGIKLAGREAPILRKAFEKIQPGSGVVAAVGENAAGKMGKKG